MAKQNQEVTEHPGKLPKQIENFKKGTPNQSLKLAYTGLRNLVYPLSFSFAKTKIYLIITMREGKGKGKEV